MDTIEHQILAEGRYEPEVAIDVIEPLTFKQEDFFNYMSQRFGVSEKPYEPLKDLLSLYDIKSDEILGTGFQCQEEDKGNLASFEQAKLAVLVRMMSKINKKWRARVKLGKASMSAVLGAKAPSSTVAKRENDEMLMEYIALLRDGVPASQRGAAAPLFENAPEYAFEGGKFEHLAMLMMKYVSEFLAGRQRELVVKQNEANGWVSPEKGYAFWPDHVSPAYGASEAVDMARRAFFAYLEGVPADAQKDMARVRLLKDYFLDAEASHWEEMHAVCTLLEGEIPEEVGKFDLELKQEDLPEKVAQAFGVGTSSLPGELIGQAQCLVRLYALKHGPFDPGTDSPEKLDYLEKMKQPFYTGLAAVILYHLQIRRKSIKIEVPGETYPSVPVYKAFKNALLDAGVDLGLSLENNEPAFKSVLNTMDTKALSYMLSMFSYASNADDGRTRFLRMDYIGEQARTKVERCAFLAELPQMLKGYSCATAHFLMSTYVSELIENTHNPLN